MAQFPVPYLHINFAFLYCEILFQIPKSLVERQKGLTTNYLHTQLDPFAFDWEKRDQWYISDSKIYLNIRIIILEFEIWRLLYIWLAFI